MARGEQKEPLYRKVNTRTRGVHHRTGGEFRHERNTRAERQRAADEIKTGTMHGRKHHGLDYTPLFRFLLSKVGEDWDAVRSEAVSRLDREAPLYLLVARIPSEQKPIVRLGENAFYSGLFVDVAGKLKKVDPKVRIEDLVPDCACCTHTFNGVPLVKKYQRPV